jgi:hypothetical protein
MWITYGRDPILTWSAIKIIMQRITLSGIIESGEDKKATLASTITKWTPLLFLYS